MSLNDRNYEEKRNFIRMTMNASAKLTIKGGESIEVTCLDLSANGMAIQTSKPVAVGANVYVSIQSPNEHFQPMSADGKILRCESLESGEFELGVEITTIA